MPHELSNRQVESDHSSFNGGQGINNHDALRSASPSRRETATSPSSKEGALASHFKDRGPKWCTNDRIREIFKEQLRRANASDLEDSSDSSVYPQSSDSSVYQQSSDSPGHPHSPTPQVIHTLRFFKLSIPSDFPGHPQSSDSPDHPHPSDSPDRVSSSTDRRNTIRAFLIAQEENAPHSPDPDRVSSSTDRRNTIRAFLIAQEENAPHSPVSSDSSVYPHSSDSSGRVSNFTDKSSGSIALMIELRDNTPDSSDSSGHPHSPVSSGRVSNFTDKSSGSIALMIELRDNTPDSSASLGSGDRVLLSDSPDRSGFE